MVKKNLLTKKALAVVLSLIMGLSIVPMKNVKASYYPAVTSVEGVYYIGVDSNKEIFGKIIANNYVFPNAGVHPDLDGFRVVAVIDTRETPNTKDDKLLYYRFPREDRGKVHILYYPM